MFQLVNQSSDGVILLIIIGDVNKFYHPMSYPLRSLISPFFPSAPGERIFQKKRENFGLLPLVLRKSEINHVVNSLGEGWGKLGKLT